MNLYSACSLGDPAGVGRYTIIKILKNYHLFSKKFQNGLKHTIIFGDIFPQDEQVIKAKCITAPIEQLEEILEVPYHKQKKPVFLYISKRHKTIELGRPSKLSGYYSYLYFTKMLESIKK